MTDIWVKTDKGLKVRPGPTVWEMSQCHMVSHVGTLTDTKPWKNKESQKYQIWWHYWHYKTKINYECDESQTRWLCSRISFQHSAVLPDIQYKSVYTILTYDIWYLQYCNSYVTPSWTWLLGRYMEDIKLQTSSPDLALTSTYLELAMFSTEAEQMIITVHSCRFAQVKVTDGRALLYPEIKSDQILGLYSLTLGISSDVIWWGYNPVYTIWCGISYLWPTLLHTLLSLKMFLWAAVIHVELNNAWWVMACTVFNS